jgi:hypothetical protein
VAIYTLRYHDAGVERLMNSLMMLGTANVKLQGRGHVLVSHDALDHVGWYLVVDEPGGV